MKVKLVIAQEEPRITKVNIETVRNGRFTVGDAITALNLPQHGRVIFRGVGATVRDAFDKDSPEIANALAVSRSLRQLAREIETAAMDEVHARCAVINPMKKLSIDELIMVNQDTEIELTERFIAESEAEAKKEKYIREAKDIPPEVVRERRAKRKAAKRAMNAAKYGTIEEIQF